MPFVLYGCETWSPTVSEEHKLRVFGNRVLRKIYGPMGEWGRQHNETLYDLYSPKIGTSNQEFCCIRLDFILTLNYDAWNQELKIYLCIFN